MLGCQFNVSFQREDKANNYQYQKQQPGFLITSDERGDKEMLGKQIFKRDNDCQINCQRQRHNQAEAHNSLSNRRIRLSR